MPLIMPSGNKKFNWSPKKGFVRSASTEANNSAIEDNGSEEQDILYSIAKQVVEKRKLVASDENSDEAFCCEDSVNEAVEKLDKAVEEVKDSIEKMHEEKCEENEEEFVILEQDEDDEVEIEDEDEDEDEDDEEVFEVSLEDEDKDEDDESGEIIVQSNEEEEGDDDCNSCDEKKVSVAASNDEFVKLSHISPETRKKTAEFWKKHLGYPSDYVDLMVKNYK